MRKFTKILLSCFLLSGCFITSCSDDAIKDDNFPDLEEDMIDITDGLNIKIIDLDKENSIRIPLGTKKEIIWELLSDLDSSRILKFNVESDENEIKYLVSESLDNILSAEEPLRIFDLKVALKNGTQEKTLKLVLRGAYGQLIPPYGQNHIGYSMVPSDSYQSTRTKILSDNAISSVLTKVNIPVRDLHPFKVFETSGQRFPDIMLSFGEFVRIPEQLLNKGLFTGGHYFGVPTQHDSVANFEDYFGIITANRQSLYMSPNILEKDRENEELYKYLDTEVNDMLNNKNTKGYRSYPNTEEGICNLLDDYGAYVIMGGTFGSTLSYLYSRKENVYAHPVAQDASKNIVLAVDDKIGNGNFSGDTWVYNFRGLLQDNNTRLSHLDRGDKPNYPINARPSKFYSKVKITGNDPGLYNNYFLNKTEEFTDTIYNVRDWRNVNEQPDDELKNNYTLVAYTPIVPDMDNNYDYSPTCYLVPIYEFIYEPIRKEAVKRYFDTYLTSQVKKFQEHNLVVKEFYMEFNKPDKGGTKHEEVPEKEGFYPSKFNDGKIVFRRAVMANYNARYDAGYPLETNQDDYILATSDALHYWYYVLGYHEDGDGFTDLRLKNSDPGNGWVGLGDNADNGTGWADNKDNLIYVMPASKNESYENKIKAVALAFNKNMNEVYGDKVFGCTPFVAMDYPFPTSSEALKETTFYKYWSTNYPKLYDDTHFYEGVVVDYPFHIIYNKQTLPDLGENGLCFGVKANGDMVTIPPVQYPLSFHK